MSRFLCLIFIAGLVVLSLGSVTAQAQSTCQSPNWEGKFYNNAYFLDNPVYTSCNQVINFNWGMGAPSATINVDNFSARWTSTQTFPVAGSYQFTVIAEGGVRLFVNGTPIIDSMIEAGGVRTLTANYVVATAGTTANLVLETTNWSGNAQITLIWSLPSGSATGGGDASGGGKLWTVEYFNNIALQGLPVATHQAPADGISRNYSTGSPAPGVGEDNWSARWTREVAFPQGTYKFTMRADDLARVKLDGMTILDQTQYLQGQTLTAEIVIATGQHMLTVEHVELGTHADLFLTWEPPIGTTLLPNGCNGGTAGTDGSAPPCPEQIQAQPSTPVFPATVRMGPSYVYPSASRNNLPIMILNSGDPVTVIGRSSDSNWLQLKAGNLMGWASPQALTLANTAANSAILPITALIEVAAPVIPPQPMPTGVQAKALGNMRIRSGPGMDFDRVGGIGWGTIVDVIGKNGDGRWWLIKTNELQGWTSAVWYEVTQGNLSSVPVLNGTPGTTAPPTTTLPTTTNPSTPCANWFFTFDAGKQDTGCPESATFATAEGQNFQGGRVYRYDPPLNAADPSGIIYVIYNDHTWQSFVDTWDRTQPISDPNIIPPLGLYQPNGSIGKLWRENPTIREKLGWAYGPASSFNGRIQRSSGSNTPFYIDHGRDGLVLRLNANTNGSQTWEVAGRYQEGFG